MKFSLELCVLTLSGMLLMVQGQVDPVLYWGMDEDSAERSCLYSIEGAPEDWVTMLTVDGEVQADPLCVNKSLLQLGPLVADVLGTNDVFMFDLLGGGIMTFEAYHDGDVRTFYGGTHDLKDLAVDVYSRNIYYTDPSSGIVMVAYGGPDAYFRVLVNDVDMPRGIVVDPLKGYVFWAESGSGSIKRMSLDGESVTTIIESLSQPTHLALDSSEERVYWVDEWDGSIGAADYNGEHERQVLQSANILPGTFSGLEVYQSYLFLLLAEEATMLIFDKETGADVTSLSFPDVTNATQHGISFAVPLNTSSSSCPMDNGGCDQICVHQEASSSRVCLCSLGYTLQPDGVSCTSVPLVDNFLILSDIGSNNLYQVALETGEVHAVPIDRTYNQRIEGVTYDPQSKTIYWTDSGNGTLRSKHLLTMEENIIFAFEVGSVVEGIALDPSSRYIYYTDVGLSDIGRVSLDTGEKEIILDLRPEEYPLQIQLDPKNQYLYWTNVGFPASIERATFDGKKRRKIVTAEVQVPSGLVLDTNRGKIYWSDEFLKRVERANLDGSGRELFQSNDKTFSIALDREYMYIAMTHEIRRFAITAVPHSTLGPKIFSNIFGVHLYSSDLAETTTLTPRTTTAAATCAHTGGYVGVVLTAVMLLLLSPGE